MRVPIIPMPRITRISPRFVTRWLSPALLPESMGCGNFNGNHRKHISIGPMAFIDPMAGSIGIRDLSDPMDPPDLSKTPVVPTSELHLCVSSGWSDLLAIPFQERVILLPHSHSTKDAGVTSNCVKPSVDSIL